MTSTPVIQLDAISKVFLTDEVETHALRSVSLSIHENEFVAVAGPSGCGKSTLLYILALLDAPDSGRYLLSGQSVEALTDQERAHVRNHRIGMIFQSFNLISDLTVFENVALPLTYRRMSALERGRRVDAVLERVRMNHRRSHLPADLSGGQQQRVAVARALVTEPSILLADEPTGNLDSQSGAVVMDCLRELNAAGTAICMVTHDERHVRCATRVIRLFDGQIAGETSP